MKKIIARHLICILMITSVSNFSFVRGEFIQIKVSTDTYCKTATICGTASEPITFMMDFVREMMNSIKTIGTEGTYLGKYVSPNRFEGNTFVAPKQGLVSRLSRNIAQKAKFAVASVAVLSSPVNFGGLKDLMGGTILLAKNKVFSRDSKLVSKLESQLSDKKLELGLGGGWYEKINAQNLTIMQGIIQKYKDNGLLTDGAINDGATYNNVTSLLTSVLSSIKTFLYFDTVSQFNDVSRGGTDGIKIKFNPVTMNIIDTDYSCARGFTDVCDKNKKKFSSVWKNLTAGLKSGWSGSTKVVADAAKRLVKVFVPSQQDDAFKARENDLLRSMYGNSNVTRGKLIDVTVKENNGSAKDMAAVGTGIAAAAVRSWNFLSKDLRGKTKEALTYKKPSSNTGSTSSSSASSSSITTTSPTDTSSSYSMTGGKLTNPTFTDYIAPYIDDLFADQARDNNLAGFVEVKDVTPAFNILGLQIYTIKNDILGGKDKDGSLIKSLGEACELQCGRGGKCR